MNSVIRLISVINDRIAIYGGGAVLLALTCLTFINVFLRYALNMPFDFSLELSEDLLTALAFLTGGYTMLVDGHVRVDILFHRFSDRQKAIQKIVTLPLVMIFFGVIIVYGLGMTYEAFEINATSPGMEWPFWPVYVLVPLGGILLGLQAVAEFLKALMEFSSSSEE